jgi:hypothetical protein
VADVTLALQPGLWVEVVAVPETLTDALREMLERDVERATSGAGIDVRVFLSHRASLAALPGTCDQ